MDIEIVALGDSESELAHGRLAPGTTIVLRRRQDHPLAPKMLDAYVRGADVDRDPDELKIGFLDSRHLDTLPPLMDGAGKPKILATYQRSQKSDVGITRLLVSVDPAGISAAHAGRPTLIRPQRPKTGPRSPTDVWI